MEKITNLQLELNNKLTCLYSDIQKVLSKEYVGTDTQYQCKIQYNKMFKKFDISITKYNDTDNTSMESFTYYNLLYSTTFSDIEVIKSILNSN